MPPSELEQFYEKYSDDLYSILVKIQKGEAIAEKTTDIILPTDQPAQTLWSYALKRSKKFSRRRSPTTFGCNGSLLVSVSRRVSECGFPWATRRSFVRLQFESFDAEFAAGIDLPHSYIENIDVVWKQEFRIGAAYEIENSTSIYSGLLRFADLNIIAPNTLYPMFIVAPNEKKLSLRNQLLRPAFRRLELDKKVWFLSYEAIDEIDQFFSSSTAGLSVDVILAKAGRKRRRRAIDRAPSV